MSEEHAPEFEEERQLEVVAPTETHHDVGTDEEIDEARKVVGQFEVQNDEVALQVISAIQQRVYQEKGLLTSVAEVSPHLITRFLLAQAAASLGVAERLLAAALEFGVAEGETPPTAPLPPVLPTEPGNGIGPEGTGQYL